MFKKKREDGGAVDTIIGNGTSVTGSIIFDDGLRIDGNFEGEIKGSGMLVIGQNGTVKADLDVVDVFIGGVVEGNINARGKVQIGNSGCLKGNIAATSLMVEDGGVFEGNSRRAATTERTE